MLGKTYFVCQNRSSLTARNLLLAERPLRAELGGIMGEKGGWFLSLLEFLEQIAATSPCYSSNLKGGILGV